jgi:hypothetical protein
LNALAGLTGLVRFLRETAKQTAQLLFPKPAADELKILPQTRGGPQLATLKKRFPASRGFIRSSAFCFSP